VGFSVNALFYGDHPDLAARLLKSLLATADWSLVDDVRFACNECCDKTRQYVYAVASSLPVRSLVYGEKDGRNVGKYPLMRRMLYEQGDRALRSTHVMWFDDDTYLTGDRSWWKTVWDLAQQHTLLGSTYSIRQRGNQHVAIRKQPWFTGKPVGANHRYWFCTGGWWVAEREVLTRWNYPWPELHHNGGDSVLGELCRQQGYSIHKFNEGVAINADEQGVESAAKRRGMETRWIWQNYTDGQVPDLSHHDFECVVASFPGGTVHAEPAASKPALLSAPPPLLRLPGLQ